MKSLENSYTISIEHHLEETITRMRDEIRNTRASHAHAHNSLIQKHNYEIQHLQETIKELNNHFFQERVNFKQEKHLLLESHRKERDHLVQTIQILRDELQEKEGL